jgi:hypothetical protein
MKPTSLPSLDFRLHGVSLRLESRHSAFLQAARSSLPDLVAQHTSEENGLPGEIHISSRLNWEEEPPPLWRQTGVRRWGRRLLQSEQRVLQTEIPALPGLRIESEWQEPRLCLEAYFQRPLTWQHLTQRLVGTGAQLAALSYYLVVFPLLHYLEQMRNLHPLHAAAAVHPAGSFLLAGLPGSGKSTFSMSFLEDPETRLISDNIVLYNKEEVFSCPETIHLSEDALRRLPAAAAARLERGGQRHSYGRDIYRLIPRARAESARPRALFFLGIAAQTTLRPIPTAPAVDRVVGMDGMAKEISAYNQFAAALDLAAPLGGQAARRSAGLHSLFQKISCFELWLEAGGDLSLGRKLICSALDEVGG